MTIEKLNEKTEKTLADLGACEANQITDLFEEVRQALEQDKDELAHLLESSGGAYFARHEELRDRWLSRKHGFIARINERWLQTAPKSLKRPTGIAFNDLRRRALDIFVGDAATQQELEATDLTLPGYQRPLGSLHPITQVQREIEDIFVNLGFGIESGPEIESVYYNFDALNIPESHPSRDDWDTLYIDSQTVLRTHTSPVQIRAMEKHGAPLYIVIPGKCYRRDNPDSTHSPMFHQIEGLAVDTNITFADLKGTLDYFARKFFGEKTRTSFHPSFFPFTEPSGEVAISCPFCDGQGCRVCKQSGWIEVMGCGMVHPAVLRNGGIDPERYTGWAFGLGVERYAMMKYGINDIQLFFQSDVRFLEQF
jgi:phenylalanyl-tRNA synthetase alpha chain